VKPIRVLLEVKSLVSVEIDPPHLTGSRLPDPNQLGAYLLKHTPEVLNPPPNTEKQLIAITGVIIGNEIVEVDVEFD